MSFDFQAQPLVSEDAPLSEFDARVLRTVQPFCELKAAQIAKRIGCAPDVAASALKRLRAHALVQVDGRSPSGWLRTYRGDVILEHQP